MAEVHRHSRQLRTGIRMALAVAAALALSAPPALAALHRFDLRWDGSSLIGGHLLNPAMLIASESGSATVSAQTSGSRTLWEFQYVKLEDNGLVGGIVVGGPDNVVAYGGGGRLSGPLVAGLSVQRRDWTGKEVKDAAVMGLGVRGRVFTLAGAALLPITEGEARETEVTLGLRCRLAELVAGVVHEGEQDPAVWGAVVLKPFPALHLAYAADFRPDGSVAAETASLRLGVERYLVLARQGAPGQAAEYFAGLGLTF